MSCALQKSTVGSIRNSPSTIARSRSLSARNRGFTSLNEGAPGACFQAALGTAQERDPRFFGPPPTSVPVVPYIHQIRLDWPSKRLLCRIHFRAFVMPGISEELSQVKRPLGNDG